MMTDQGEPNEAVDLNPFLNTLVFDDGGQQKQAIEKELAYIVSQAAIADTFERGDPRKNFSIELIKKAKQQIEEISFQAKNEEEKKAFQQALDTWFSSKLDVLEAEPILEEMPPGLKNLVNIVVDESTMQVWYKDDGSITLVDIWDGGVSSVPYVPRPAQEGQDNETIDAAKLEELVQGSMNAEGPNAWARWAAQLANLPGRPSINVKNVGERMLQQTVYSPVAALLNSFNSKWYSYVADQHAKCSYGVYSRTLDQFLQINGKPDAALLGPKERNVLAVMELKACSHLNAHDMYKCVLMTSASALAFRTAARKKQGTGWEKIEVPFILGNGETVRLFVTRVVHVGAPVIEMIFQSEMDVPSGRTGLLTRLGVLVSDLIKQLKQWLVELTNIADPPPGAPNALTTSTKRTQENEPDTKRHKTGNAGAAEAAARAVASRGGKVTGLVCPWPLILDLDDPDRTAAFQQRSPFYFKGQTSAFRPVFCKVWREGDRKTDRELIAKEIEFLKLANSSGVPSPLLIAELTAMDVKHPLSSPDTYHVLVTTELRRDNVTSDTVQDYAFSLVQAVLQLHGCGVLHCDIKPSNVAWDSKNRAASLLDFGHAQKEDGAESYLATEGFEAPEILQKQPHSRATDAYSVGATLSSVVKQSQANSSSADNRVRIVERVAEQLLMESPTERMTLDEAKSALLVGAPSNESPPLKRTRTDVTKVSRDSERKVGVDG